MIKGVKFKFKLTGAYCHVARSEIAYFVSLWPSGTAQSDVQIAFKPSSNPFLLAAHVRILHRSTDSNHLSL